MCAFKQRIQRSSPLPVQTEAHSGRRLCTVVFYTCRTSREGREVLSILEQIRPMRGRTSRSMHYSKRLYRRCLHRNLWFANRCGLHSATGTDYVCINEKNHILLLFFCINTIYIYIVYSCPDQACEAEVDLLENTNHMYTQELVTLLGLVNSIGWKW